MKSSAPQTTDNSKISTNNSQQKNGSVSSTQQNLQSPARKVQNIIAIKPRVKRKVVELFCSEVRWFFRRKEDTKWMPFRGYDSTVLEVAFRRQKGLEFDEETTKFLYSLPESVIVMEGNYVADEQLQNINAIYWKEDTFQIRRGTWFYMETCQPLPDDFADTIETHHLKSFKGNVIPETPVFSESESSKKPELTTVKWGDEKVCWNSVVDVHIASKSNAVILVIHGIGQKGYENLIAKNTAQIRDAVIHQMDKYYPNEKRRPAILPIEWRSTLQLDNGMTDVVTLPKMVWARSTLNSVCMDLMYYHSPLYRSEIVNGVIKCLNNVYTSFLENNPDFSGPVSVIGHSLGSVIAYDILTNWSPFLLYDQFVTNAIAENLEQNFPVEQKQLLEQFYHSRKKMLDLGDLMEQILVRQDEPLKFKVKYLFCLGSPLAVFTIMRGADYRSIVPDKDKIERIFNIFHPYDPVSYRLEPMFHENYKHIRPIKLFNYRDAIKPYDNNFYDCHKKRPKSFDGDDEDETQYFEDDSDSDVGCQSSSPRSITPHNIDNNTNATLTPATPTIQELKFCDTDSYAKINKDQTEIDEQALEVGIEPGVDDEEKFKELVSDVESNQQKTVASHDILKTMGEAGRLVEEIPPERRINQRLDFQVQPWTLEKSYWSMLRSHFSYWTNPDVAAFLLNTIYPQPENSENP
uniref:DDHD domain-containing protein n=1 Tax=Meloidogyne javanica TaxID=6303 RepID=A0A915M781_MELJA